MCLAHYLCWVFVGLKVFLSFYHSGHERLAVGCGSLYLEVDVFDVACFHILTIHLLVFLILSLYVSVGYSNLAVVDGRVGY